MTNVINRLALLKNPATVIDVFSAADLPDLILAPDGVMRSPLKLERRYTVHGTFPWPRLLFPPITSLMGFQITEIVGARGGTNILCDGDSTPHFWGRDSGLIRVSNTSIVDISNGGAGRGTVLFDAVGGGPFSNVLIDGGMATVNFKSAGKFVDYLVLGTIESLVGCEGGRVAFFTAPSSISAAESQLLMAQAPAAAGGLPMKKPYWFIGGAGGSNQFSIGAISCNPGDPLFAIDSASTGTFNFSANSYQAASGEFFRPDVSLALTAMANVDKAITAFSAQSHAITSVSAGLAGTAFSTGAVRHQFNVGDTVTHAGFADGAYSGVKTIVRLSSPFAYEVAATVFTATDTGTTTNNLATVVDSTQSGFTRGQTVLFGGATPGAYAGLQTIKSVDPNEDSFVIPVAFSVGGTGDIKITRVTTASDHPMVVSETATIVGTTSYNQTSVILFTNADDTFDIPVAFVADDATGTVSSVSKTEKSIGVDCKGNEDQPDSRTIGWGLAKDNATATDMSGGPNVWVDLNLNASVVASTTLERCTLTNTTTGELRYDATRDFSGDAVLSITVSSVGGAQEFEFRIVKNGSVLANLVVQGSSIGSDGVNVTVIVPISAVTNDLFRGQVQNVAGTSNCVIEQFSFSIKASGS